MVKPEIVRSLYNNFKRSLANIVRFTLAQEAEEAAVPQLQKKTSKAEARSSRSTAPEEDVQSRGKKQLFPRQQKKKFQRLCSRKETQFGRLFALDCGSSFEVAFHLRLQTSRRLEEKWWLPHVYQSAVHKGT